MLSFCYPMWMDWLSGSVLSFLLYIQPFIFRQGDGSVDKNRQKQQHKHFSSSVGHWQGRRHDLILKEPQATSLFLLALKWFSSLQNENNDNAFLCKRATRLFRCKHTARLLRNSVLACMDHAMELLVQGAHSSFLSKANTADATERLCSSWHKCGHLDRLEAILLGN